MKFAPLPAILLATLLPLSAPAAEKAPPSVEELWAIIQKQQAEIEALKNQQQETAKQAAEADEKAEAAVVAVEDSGSGKNTKSSWADKTTIGGYGELHYNNINNDGIDDKNEIDFHRFVLFFGHEFSDRLRLFSELELEHALAGDDKNGEVELEQAYIEYDIRDNVQTKGGLFLMPVGILNETHEPPTFYGVERNDVENIIVPSTWWEAGAALNGYYDNGISWDLALTSGLAIPTSGDDAFVVRDGRQKVSEAIAKGDVNAINYFLGQAYVAAFEKLATSPQQRTVIIPAEFSSILGTIEGIRGLTDSAKATNAARPQGGAVPPSRT